MRCYKCGEGDSGYVKILDVIDVKAECPGRVLNVKVIKENHGRGSGQDHQDYGGECWVILKGQWNGPV